MKATGKYVTVVLHSTASEVWRPPRGLGVENFTAYACLAPNFYSGICQYPDYIYDVLAFQLSL